MLLLNPEPAVQIYTVQDINPSMTAAVLHKDPDSSITKLCCIEETEPYYVESTPNAPFYFLAFCMVLPSPD